MGEATCISYDDCSSGTDVTRCCIKGGGQGWFGSSNCAGADGACAIVRGKQHVDRTTARIWAFFEAHARQ